MIKNWLEPAQPLTAIFNTIHPLYTKKLVGIQNRFGSLRLTMKTFLLLLSLLHCANAFETGERRVVIIGSKNSRCLKGKDEECLEAIVEGSSAYLGGEDPALRGRTLQGKSDCVKCMKDWKNSYICVVYGRCSLRRKLYWNHWSWWNNDNSWNWDSEDSEDSEDWQEEQEAETEAEEQAAAEEEAEKVEEMKETMTEEELEEEIADEESHAEHLQKKADEAADLAEQAVLKAEDLEAKALAARAEAVEAVEHAKHLQEKADAAANSGLLSELTEAPTEDAAEEVTMSAKSANEESPDTLVDGEVDIIKKKEEIEAEIDPGCWVNIDVVEDAAFRAFMQEKLGALFEEINFLQYEIQEYIC